MSMKTTEEATSLRRRAPPTPVVRLLYAGAAGVAEGPARELAAGETVIGRDVPPAGTGIGVPEDTRASRRHAVLVLDRGGLRVADAGSRNGTYINGERVSEGALRDGDLLRVGDSFLLVRFRRARQADAPMEGLFGTAPEMGELRGAIRLAGPSAATVLLLGESGTGKEVAARALHQQSGRRGPFVAVNCSAIPDSLAESQLFGHAPGAFTGAAPGGNPGFFRAAHGGTLFLDEVGELSAALQPKLLRVLEERAVVPLGTVKPIACDLRILAATNRDLEQAAEAGTFRRDLYTRLSEIILRLPPLRARREDVLPLLLRGLGAPAPRLAADLVEALLLHRWPGNVRELLKVATELRVRGAGAAVLDLELVADRFPGPAAAPVKGPAPAAAARAPRAEDAALPVPGRERLESLLRQHRGIVADVARVVGRSRRQVYRWLEQHGLDADAFRAPEQS